MQNFILMQKKAAEDYSCLKTATFVKSSENEGNVTLIK